jgi:PDZ domain-containing protein
MLRLLRWVLALALIAVVATGGVLLWAQAVSSDDFAFMPAAAQPALPVVTLEGQAEPPPGAGSVYFSTVTIRRASVYETWAGVDDGGALVPEYAVMGPDQTDEDKRELDQLTMRASQQAAEVVALRALGVEVEVVDAGVRVVGLPSDSPVREAGGRVGDLIVGLGDEPVRTVARLRTLLAEAGADREVGLVVHRDGGTETLRVRTIDGPDGRVMIGIVPGQETTVETDRPVAYAVDGVGGSSAGLAFALQIYSAGRGYANLGGLRVAATGTLELDGTVRSVGGVAQKAIGAARSDIDLFLVPDDNLEEARAAAPEGLQVVGVGSFDEALAAVEAAART